MGNSKKKIRHADWSRRLIQLSQEAAAVADNDDMAPVEHQLAQLVERVITRGSDRPIQHAIEQLDAQHHHDAAELIEFWADEMASILGVRVATQDAVETGASAAAFLIPLILIGQRPHTSVPLTIPTDVTLDRLTRSLRQHALIGPNPSVILLPGFYRLTDLPDSWARRREWLQQIIAGAAHQPAAVPQASVEPHPLTFDDAGTTLYLRFLVGIVITADDDADPIPFMVDYQLEDDSATDQALHAVGEWQQDVASILTPVMKHISVVVAAPEIWTDARNSGIHLANEVALDLLAGIFLNQAVLDPHDVVAVIEWDTDEAFWLITLQAPSSVSEALHWNGPLDYREELEQIMEILRAHGVGRFSVNERI